MYIYPIVSTRGAPWGKRWHPQPYMSVIFNVSERDVINCFPTPADIWKYKKITHVVRISQQSGYHSSPGITAVRISQYNQYSGP